MEPQWNPMAEEQALDRVHRIGQSRPVVATRYIVKDSIEDVCNNEVNPLFFDLLTALVWQYVVSLQKKKLDLIQQSLGPRNPLKTNTIKEKLQVSCRLGLRYFR